MADGYGVPPHVEDLTNEKLMDLMNVTTANLGKGQLSVVYEHHAYDFIDAILREDKIEKQGVAINGRVHRHGGDVHFFTATENAEGNFSTVGN